MIRTLVFAIALLSAASAARADPPPDAPWVSAYETGHPLAGSIWQPAQERFVTPEAVAAALGQARIVLLGEKHDNADHHRLQAWLVTSLASANRRPAVAFEMLAKDDQSLIDAQVKKAPNNARGLAVAVRWDEKGWPEWHLYEPIFEAVLRAGLPILATNLSRATIKALAVDGSSALNSDLVREYGLDRPLAPELNQRLTEELKASHCGHASPKTIEKMILVQRARDAQMARRLATVGGKDGAVLMAGAFHVRKDEGVPVHLAKSDRDGVVSLAFVEVRDEATDPGEYAKRFGSDRLPFDFVWFTPRVDDEDPCEKFAKQLQQMKKRPSD